MRSYTPRIQSLSRTLVMLEAVIHDGGMKSVSELARSAGIPVATAHRQVGTLVAEGFLTPVGKRQHVAGARLLALARQLDERQVVVNVAAPFLHELAIELGAIVQLGTYDNGMVTYRIKTGHGAKELFTKVGMQLEAYCSAIGKILLAHLPQEEQHAYLADGPFVALTNRTITDPEQLAYTLAQILSDDFAVDDGEIVEGLTCVAVPIRRTPSGQVIAAVSASFEGVAVPPTATEALPRLRAAIGRIERAAFG